MSNNGRITLIFLFNLLLYFIAGEVNGLLGTFSVYFHIEALLVIFFGLYLNRISSLLYTSLLGFMADAVHPTPAGTYLIGYLFLWMFFVWCQRRIHRQKPIHVRSVAAAGQAIWLIALSILMGKGLYGEWAYWSRILTEILLSCLLVYVTSWTWCTFQKRTLYSLGWNIEAQMSHR